MANGPYLTRIIDRTRYEIEQLRDEAIKHEIRARECREEIAEAEKLVAILVPAPVPAHD